MTASPRTLSTIRSANRKTGAIPTTGRTQDSCPPECPAFRKYCYAEQHRGPGILPMFVQVAASAAAVDDPDPTAVIRDHRYRNGPRGFRLNTSGDFLRDAGTAIDTDYIESANATARSLRERFATVTWSYTHAWRRPGMTPHLFDFVVRASCETVDDVRAAHAGGWSAVITVTPDSPLIQPDPETGRPQTVDGRAIVQCPAQTSDRTCADCRLCGRNAAVVAFVIHGAKRAAGARQLAVLNQEEPAR